MAGFGVIFLISGFSGNSGTGCLSQFARNNFGFLDLITDLTSGFSNFEYFGFRFGNFRFGLGISGSVPTHSFPSGRLHLRLRSAQSWPSAPLPRRFHTSTPANSTHICISPVILALGGCPSPRRPPLRRRPRRPAMGVLTAAELNFLVFRYLQESGACAPSAPSLPARLGCSSQESFPHFCADLGFRGFAAAGRLVPPVGLWRILRC
jgi:hypothetical protein